jgi:hypothetical protein
MASNKHFNMFTDMPHPTTRLRSGSKHSEQAEQPKYRSLYEIEQALHQDPVNTHDIPRVAAQLERYCSSSSTSKSTTKSTNS